MSVEIHRISTERAKQIALFASIALMVGPGVGAAIDKYKGRKATKKTEQDIVDNSHSGEASQLIFSREYPNH